MNIGNQAPTAPGDAFNFGEIPPGMHCISKMGVEGDTKLIWDKSKPAEVEGARAHFDALTSKGYRAYHVTGKDGSQGEQMKTFDHNAERIIMIPAMVGG